MRSKKLLLLARYVTFWIQGQQWQYPHYFLNQIRFFAQITSELPARYGTVSAKIHGVGAKMMQGVESEFDRSDAQGRPIPIDFVKLQARMQEKLTSATQGWTERDEGISRCDWCCWLCCCCFCGSWPDRQIILEKHNPGTAAYTKELLDSILKLFGQPQFYVQTVWDPNKPGITTIIGNPKTISHVSTLLNIKPQATTVACGLKK